MDREPVPDLKRTETAIESPAVRSTSLVVIAVLATLYTLYFARAFFVPIVFAILLTFLLSPAIRALTRIKIRPPLGAAIVVVALLAAVGGGVYALAGPAQSVAESAPASLAKANAKLRTLFLARVQKATNQVEQAAGTIGDSVGQRPRREIVVNTAPSIGSRLLGTTQVIVAAVLEITFLLYFLLAGGDLFLQKFIKVL
ncbi:MAG TPA: AI-2E family transporter, partial [Gemmatimonadaceae bacterium]